MSKIIFISSPYSHQDDSVRIENFKKVSKFVAELTSQGHVVMSPIVYGHTLLDYKEMPSDWEFWKNFCVTFLEKCEEMIVYKMEGWDRSRGVAEEIEFAKSKNIPIKFVEYQEI
jgi:hypothetical protein